VNDKFESLVLFCFYRLEERNKALEQLEQQITQERERLYKLQHATRELRQLETDLKTTQHYFSIVERRAKQIAEAADL
jgi:TolA-binding protein